MYRSLCPLCGTPCMPLLVLSMCGEPGCQNYDAAFEQGTYLLLDSSNPVYTLARIDKLECGPLGSAPAPWVRLK